MNIQRLFIISGPSGSGQDSVIEGLRAHFPIERVITTTTRAPRPSESEGSPYYFVSQEVFKKSIAQGDFFEYAQHYNSQYYGVTKKEIERVTSAQNIGIWKLDWQGVVSAKKLLPEIIAFFLFAPRNVLRERILRRDHPTPEFLEERMRYTEDFFAHENIYDYSIENQEGKLEEAVSAIARIITEKVGSPTH